MEFLQYYSSSAANLYELRMNHERVLIDPGVSLAKIRSAGIALAGCSVWRSHSHMDHSMGWRELVDRMVLQESIPDRTWDVQHDVPCQAAEWVDAETGESIVFAIDTGSFDPLPATGAIIYALECNYQDEYLTIDPTTQRVRENHASLAQVIDYLSRCDLRDTREIHLLHMSGRHSNRTECVSEVEQTFAIPAYAIG